MEALNIAKKLKSFLSKKRSKKKENVIMQKIEAWRYLMRGDERVTQFLIQYSDNDPVQVALQISLSCHDWNELKKQAFFQETMKYLTCLQIQKNQELFDYERQLWEIEQT